MIFKQWQQVLDGTKTQTRRLIRPSEFASGSRDGARQEIFGVWKDIHDLQDRSGQFGFVRTPLQILQSLYRLKWHKAMGCFRDKTYAIQPGRGKKAVGRIRITGIRRERIQDITPEDCRKEGLNPVQYTSERVILIPDLSLADDVLLLQFHSLWNSIHTKKGTRWEDNPEAWVLEFEVINDNTI